MNQHPRELSETADKGGSAPLVCDARPPAFPLMLAAAGEEVCVRAISGAPAFVRRLMDLGLRAGLRARVVQHNAAGVVLAMDGMRLALGPAAAAQIMVGMPALCAAPGREGSPR